MAAKIKIQLTFLLTAFILLSLNITTNAQTILDRALNRAEKKAEAAVNKKVDNAVDNLFEPKKKKNGGSNNAGANENNNSTSRPKLSELRDEDFIQNEQNPERDQNNTRYAIAKNLLIDINGIYPNEYKPYWRFINYNSSLSFTTENWLFPKANTSQERKNISIGDYRGKAVIRLDAFTLCHCFADIIVKDSFAVITENPQTFEIANFRKILNDRSTGEPCMPSNNWHYAGGWAGKITLSANKNGDITMDLMLENYSAEHGSKPSQVSIRYIAKGITVENEMSAEKANGIIAAEKEAKQRQKDYIAKTTKQADLLQKEIAKKYPQAECRSCFYSSRGSYISSTTVDQYYVRSGDYAGSRTDYDLNIKTEIKNKCSYKLMFIGIQQLYNEERGYYLVEVTKTMEAGYNYSADQGMMSSLFTSLIGGGSEFNFAVQDKYAVNYASVNSVQWLKVIKGK